jgi:hypothetical protein
MPFFICPNCGHREVSGERTAGFSTRPKGCSKCGFGFVFELLDDYYPAPNAAFFVCDKQERVIDAGKGSFELTGLTDEDVIGRPVREVLGLDWIDSGDGGAGADTDGDGVSDPIETSLEWGSARSASESRSTPRAICRPARLPTSSPPTTTTGACSSSSPRRVRRWGPGAATSSSCCWSSAW